MLWTKIILKKFLFESCVNDFIVSHSVSSESYAKYAPNKADNIHTYSVKLRRVRLNITVMENQTLLLSCIGAKNCCQNPIVSILFPSSKKKKSNSSFKQNDKKFDFSQICIYRPILLQVTSSTFHENPS
jgi:hypothetical protein